MSILMLMALTRGVAIGALTGGIFMAVGASIALWGWSFIARDRAIGRWPRAPATITASTYKASDGTSRDAQGYDVSSTSFVPDVAFQYTVDGKAFAGNRVTRAMTPTTDSASVKACIDRYPRGARVEVFYNPADPATAYLA